jgi:flagellar hook assembly protein FlgD
MGAFAEMQLQIYDLSGREVFDSGRVPGHALTWKGQNAVGEPVANGIYLYVVTAQTLDGRTLKSEVRKVVILR